MSEMTEGKGSGRVGEDAPEYDEMMELEDLEGLLEELEEGGWDADLGSEHMPRDLKERVEEAGVRDMVELKQKIARLHVAMDDEDS
ncbi:MAG: hypothetical protein WCD37_14930 [Chloroflexia bacterium]